MVVARKWVAVAKFQGEPKRSDFQMVEEQLPALRDGEVLTQAEYISVDPYMRAYAASMQVPYDQFGYQVAKIIESKDPKHPVGTRVVSHAGWRDLTILKMSEPQLLNVGSHVLPDIGSLPTSHGIGAVGMPGMTAYFGFLEICQPKAGETVVVTGAAGAVGSLVGQIAKIKGCKVIGFVGSDKKVKILTEECGFDHAFNYKTADIAKVLKQAAPNGIDCYFDNVGGEISSIILSQMNTSGRVSVCGSISCYNDDTKTLPKASIIQASMVFKQIKMEGFLVWRWADRAEEAYKQMSAWLQSGKLVAKEHVTEGFDNLYDALVGMMRGDNVGKAVVKV